MSAAQPAPVERTDWLAVDRFSSLHTLLDVVCDSCCEGIYFNRNNRPQMCSGQMSLPVTAERAFYLCAMLLFIRSLRAQLRAWLAFGIKHCQQGWSHAQARGRLLCTGYL